MNTFIFDMLCKLKRKFNNQEIRSISIEVKYVNISSRFFLSILLNSDDEIEYDEIVIEIKSNDEVFFDMDLSDSSGNIYLENKNISDKKEVIDFLGKVEEQLVSIIMKLLKY